jgi:hypothetical protein
MIQRRMGGVQQGLATVELAIVLPVLLLLMLAVAELGRLLYQYGTLTKAVQDGARYLSATARLGSTQVIDLTNGPHDERARNLVVYGALAPTGSPVLPHFSTEDVVAECLGGGGWCPHVDHISVRASYTYRPLVGAVLPTFGFGEPIAFEFTLHASATMRAL